jgi:hypothetical protein
VAKPRNTVRAGALRKLWILAGVVCIAASMAPGVRADEIRFRSRDAVQAGTVLEDDGGTVTVRFPRESIESIRRTPRDSGGEAQRAPVPGLEERVRELEKKVGSLPVPVPPPGREEAGGVEGVIRWKERPLSRGRVMIVPAKTAGLPPESRENARAGIAGAPVKAKDDRFETETDDAGRYRFERVPPGDYLFYWMPGGETGWVRRLREKPDLEVVPGRVTVLNIPADGK